jgi:5-methylcytosine-specific restriction enzyme subunit McrC
LRTETIIESTAVDLDLTKDQAVALNAVGRRLASKKTWWKDGEAPKDRSVISCMPVTDNKWRVRIADAVGIVSVSGLQIIVQPKIPAAHFLFILGHSGVFPRLDSQRAQMAESKSLWELVAMWFVSSLELLLRRDLVKDYQETRDALTAIRGSVDALATSVAYCQGRLECVCDFDEFDFDTANNRVLKAASLEVVGSLILPADLRRHAARLLARLQEVGELRPRDVSAAMERRTAYYGDALMLATNVLQGRGRDLQVGESSGWTFLLRTPEMVEEGIRSILQKSLCSKWRITKRGIQIERSNMTLTPDLVFESMAVGDVKYKIAEEWLRSDLYQAVTFAEGFETKYGCIVSFATEQSDPFPAVKVGQIVLNHFQWRAEPALAPEEASKRLLEKMDEWLEKIEANVGVWN